MALSSAFFDAVNNGNVRRVRIMMEDSLLLDPSFTEFSEMEKAAASLEGLYDVHDGRKLIGDKSLWNDDYMNKLMVQVVNNFSHERVDHLKSVVKFLRPINESTRQNKATPSTEKTTNTSTKSSEPKSSYQEQKARDQKNGSYLGAKIATGAVAGAVVGGVVASIAGVTVVGGAVVGGVIGSAAVTIAVNGGK